MYFAGQIVCLERFMSGFLMKYSGTNLLIYSGQRDSVLIFHKVQNRLLFIPFFHFQKWSFFSFYSFSSIRGNDSNIRGMATEIFLEWSHPFCKVTNSEYKVQWSKCQSVFEKTVLRPATDANFQGKKNMGTLQICRKELPSCPMHEPHFWNWIQIIEQTLSELSTELKWELP